MKFYQQGDVLLKVGKVPKDAKETKDPILAYGEATGHKHVVVYDEPESVQFFKEGNVIYLKALRKFKVNHEEHHQIEVPPGEYEIGIVREYDHFDEEARAVVD